MASEQDELVDIAAEAKDAVIEGDEDLGDLLRLLQMSSASIDLEKIESDRPGVRYEEMGEAAKRAAEVMACGHEALEIILSELEVETEDFLIRLGREDHELKPPDD